MRVSRYVANFTLLLGGSTHALSTRVKRRNAVRVSSFARLSPLRSPATIYRTMILLSIATSGRQRVADGSPPRLIITRANNSLERSGRGPKSAAQSRARGSRHDRARRNERHRKGVPRLGTSDAKNGHLYHSSSFALFLPSCSLPLAPAPSLSLSRCRTLVVAPSATSPASPAEKRANPRFVAFFACDCPARDAQKSATAAKPGYREP